MKGNTYIISTILFFTLCVMLTACRQSIDKNDASSSSTETNSLPKETRETSYSFEENKIMNTLFQERLTDCTAINYWYMDSPISITDKTYISQVLNILSSVELSTSSADEKAGGIHIDVVCGEKTYSLTIFSDHIIYNNYFYDTDDNILEKLYPFMENYCKIMGLEAFEE